MDQVPEIVFIEQHAEDPHPERHPHGHNCDEQTHQRPHKQRKRDAVQPKRRSEQEEQTDCNGKRDDLPDQYQSGAAQSVERRGQYP
ncbi:hypothetical protein D3C75_1263270 [compost metagenome]